MLIPAFDLNGRIFFIAEGESRVVEVMEVEEAVKFRKRLAETILKALEAETEPE